MRTCSACDLSDVIASHISQPIGFRDGQRSRARDLPRIRQSALADSDPVVRANAANLLHAASLPTRRSFGAGTGGTFPSYSSVVKPCSRARGTAVTPRLRPIAVWLHALGIDEGPRRGACNALPGLDQNAATRLDGNRSRYVESDRTLVGRCVPLLSRSPRYHGSVPLRA